MDHNDRVTWNGSTYSGRPYRIEDLRTPPSPPEPAPRRKKRGAGAVKAVALVLCCALLGGFSGIGGAAIYNTFFAPEPAQSASGPTTIWENNTTPGSQVNVEQADGLTPMTLTEIYSAYVDSCVVITCEVPYTTNGWYGPYSGVTTSAGSGFVITQDGYIVTNYHVVEGAESIRITFESGETYEAEFVGGEEANDVAVLKIDADGLDTVVLGDSDALLVGETVSTIGNALGTLSFSQTSGHVSALGRSVTYSDGTIINMLQTDCTINSGNSGGPLFDQYGRVAGITSAKYSNNGDYTGAAIENIGFAIPINDVKSIITDIMEQGYVVRPQMGITVATVTEEYASYFGWPGGVYVNGVEEGSCAEAAGIRKGDIITKLGDTEVTTSAELTAAKNRYQPGDTAEVTVYRADQYLTLTITFDAGGAPNAAQDGSSSGPQEGGGYNDNPFGGYYGGFGR